MKIMIDMNLSPAWVTTFEEAGFEAHHWSEMGSPNAKDEEIFTYARANNFVVFTHDLDFGDILAATGAKSPSVIQVRSQDTSPATLKNLMLNVLERFKSHLLKGALITILPDKARARVLPIDDFKD